MSTKNEISYAEERCREVEEQVKQLEKKLEEHPENLNNKALLVELKEVQKLLNKHTEQLEHLRSHNSKPLKIVLGFTLMIFTFWMIFVLGSNWWNATEDKADEKISSMEM